MNVRNAQTIITQQPFRSLDQSRLLRICPRVFRLTTLVAAAHIADTDAPAVVALTMSTNRPHGAPSMHRAIPINYEMIPDAVKTSLLMPTVDVLYRIIAPALSRSAMQDNLVRVASKLKRPNVRKLMLHNLNHRRPELC